MYYIVIDGSVISIYLPMNGPQELRMPRCWQSRIQSLQQDFQWASRATPLLITSEPDSPSLCWLSHVFSLIKPAESDWSLTAILSQRYSEIWQACGKVTLVQVLISFLFMIESSRLSHCLTIRKIAVSADRVAIWCQCFLLRLKWPVISVARWVVVSLLTMPTHEDVAWKNNNISSCI